MKSKKKNFILLSFILLIPSFSLIYLLKNNFNTFKSIPKIYLNVDAAIRLNKKVTSQAVFSGEELTFSVEVPARNIHIKVSWDTFWGMDLSLTVANDEMFSEIIATSDNLGGSNEKIDLKIQSPKIIYIKVYCNSGQGFFSILVSDDISIIIITTVLLVLIAVAFIIGLLTYSKLKKKKKTKTQKYVSPEINPYRIEEKGRSLSEEKSQYNSDVNFCIYCGQKLTKNAKICENCGTEVVNI
ncbi:MAG: zinc ribbon domain-containing protein [Candidatus Thorarchaeota archaeon]